MKYELDMVLTLRPARDEPYTSDRMTLQDCIPLGEQSLASMMRIMVDLDAALRAAALREGPPEGLRAP